MSANAMANGHVSARDGVLAKVRQSLRDVTMDGSAARGADYAAIPRDYIQQGDSSREAVLALLSSRLQDYDATVYPCLRHEIARTVAVAMKARGKTSLLHPDQLPEEWLPAGYAFSRVNGLPDSEIDRGEGVITGCLAAIALTGTIILHHGSVDGRRALTLIPDYHLCVVFADQVVETVPEGFRRLAGMATLPLTTVSGPSATADIEMSRVKGVHGPRFLDVILVA
jgi:L-lactate dehydrogenase complex protein LldG